MRPSSAATTWLRAIVHGALVVMALPLAAFAQNQPTKDDVRVAVQRFYNWYVPFANKANERPWMTALHRAGIAFSPEIVRALEQDSVAQSRAEDTIDGLDYDPLLNAQDPCEQYRVLSVRQAGTNYVVEIAGRGGCDNLSAPHILAEVTMRRDTLVFVNFRDPAQPEHDLLSTLRRLQGGGRPR